MVNIPGNLILTSEGDPIASNLLAALQAGTAIALTEVIVSGDKKVNIATSGVPRILNTVTGIDGKVVATTNLYTVPAGVSAVITGAIIVLTAVGGGSPPGIFPEVGVGVAAGEDDILSQTKITGLDILTEAYHFNTPGIKRLAAAAEVIKLGVDVGSNATTYTMTVYLLGYEI